MMLKATDSYDIRRYMAMAFMAGGSMAMTIMAAFILFGLWGNPALLFWMGLGCLILIGIQQTGFISLVSKREIHLDADDRSVIIKDLI